MVDYSKWKDIEVSDDEDETHPNIDTPSLFKWRHEARVQKMEEQRKEKEALDEQKRKLAKEKESLKKAASTDVSKKLDELKLKEVEVKKKEDEMIKKEKVQPWNVDTISKEGFSKSVLNTQPKPKPDELSEDEREEKMRQFIKEHEKPMKHYGMLQKYEDSKQYLTENNYLACEEMANYLVIWCVNLQMEEKTELMNHVAHQAICLQFILELGKQLDVDPRACVSSFFTRIQMADLEYKKAFTDELEAFKDRVTKRSADKLEKIEQQAEEELRQERLGPGGLDPVEVFETLPEELQKCFESQDIPLLQQVISQMNEDDAKYHMKRCVDSGLWVADAKKAEAEKAEAEKAEDEDASSTLEAVD